MPYSDNHRRWSVESGNADITGLSKSQVSNIGQEIKGLTTDEEVLDCPPSSSSRVASQGSGMKLDAGKLLSNRTVRSLLLIYATAVCLLQWWDGLILLVLLVPRP